VAQVSLARRAVKAVIPPHVRGTLHIERNVLRSDGPVVVARWNAALLDSWARDRLNRRRYVVLDEAKARAARRSDRVFIFGSGASMNDIPDEEWTAMAQHDTFGFNAFYNQRWVRVDFHLIRGGTYGALFPVARARELRQELDGNPLYADTVFVLQEEYLGHYANFIVGRGVLPRGQRLLRYRTLFGTGPASRRLADGIRHAPGTLMDAVNVAYCLGWKEIVLVGVDLYDSRYFWLPPDQTLTYTADGTNVVPGTVNTMRGNTAQDTHNTVRGGVIDVMAEWRRQLDEDGVRLSVYNPRSLLAGTLPVFEWAEAPAR
jgi:hypothetical protein